jgi:cytochrome c oxidase assembly protein subunit 15
LAAVYFLILVGSVVRATGSGMGCPDWPKCFGSWVPPTSIQNLPSKYKEDYIALRHKKNVKFAKFLSAIGMKETASKLLSDNSVQQETEFNATKTWIEYVNRLIGVVVGLLIILLVIKSYLIKSSNPRGFWISVLVLIVVVIQGWFGSIVVSTNLTTWTVTVHMLMAFILIALLVCLFEDEEEKVVKSKRMDQIIVILSVILLLVQVYFGTQVRELVDQLASQLVSRESWIAQIGSKFILHRSFSWLVLIVHVILFYRLVKSSLPKSLLLSLLLLILLSVLTGVGMAYGSVPAWLQPVHLLVATLVFGLQMSVLFKMKIQKATQV